MTRRIKLTATGEKPIPPNDDFPANVEIRTYVLSVKVENTFVQLYFKKRPTRPDWSHDGPLDLRVPSDCRIRLMLDPDLRWSFRHDFRLLNGEDAKNAPWNDAITLKSNAQDKYYNLTHVSDQELYFDAEYTKKNTINFDNCDPINIYVDFDQYVDPVLLGARTLKRTAIRIDPDIQNPGDPPNSN